MKAVVLPLLCLAGALPAADLLSELSLAAPRIEDHAGPNGSVVEWLAFAEQAPLRRIDGVALVTRDQAVPDAQVAVGLGWNRLTSGSGDFGGTNYNWSRLMLRAGSDPLANESAQAFVGVQGLWSAANMLSAAVDAGWSADRGAVLSAEACLWFVRLRGERDDNQTSFRIGTGPRFLGSDGPWSGAVMVDYVSGRAYDAVRVDCGQVEGWIAYRLGRHVVLSAQAQAASRVRLPDGTLTGASSGALVVGCTW